MSDLRNGHIEDVWSRLKSAYIAYSESVRSSEPDEAQEIYLNGYLAAVNEFLVEDLNRVKLLKVKLKSADAKMAVVMLEHLDSRELEGLLSELVFLAASTHWAVQRVRDAILRLPRKWVLPRVEAIAEPLLAEGTYDEYRRLLELYVLLDPALTQRLAERAVQHPDPDIREAGEDFLT